VAQFENLKRLHQPERLKHTNGTPKRARSGDVNQIAASIVAKTTGQTKTLPGKSGKSKNPAAVSLGRLGGLKGGKARAKKLSARKRKAIALKGAKARWSKSE
jgi:hypothetical protein